MTKREDRSRARLARVLALACAALTAGCEWMVGADFESGHPKSDAGSAGSVASGSSGPSGGANTGTAGRDSSGGSAAGGMDAGDAGDAGADGFTGECRENVDCFERHGGDPYVCRRNRCVEVLSGDDCPIVIPEVTLGRTALEQLRDEDPILIGAFGQAEAADRLAVLHLGQVAPFLRAPAAPQRRRRQPARRHGGHSRRRQ